MNFYVELAKNLPGWLYEGEPEYLWELARQEGPGDLLEVGSWVGKSTVILGGAAKETGCKVYAVDSFQMDGTPRQVEEHRRSGFRGTFYQFLHNIAVAGVQEHVIPIAALSERALPHLDLHLRLAFLDGTHDYEHIQADMSMVRPMILKGGVIAVHDVCDDWPEMAQGFWDWQTRYQDEYQILGVRGRIAALWRR